MKAFRGVYKPRFGVTILSVGFALAMLVGFETGVLASMPVWLLPLIVAVAIFGSAFFRRGAARASYVRGLQAPEPGPLVASVDKTLAAARALPDHDAYLAQSRAVAYVLYGRGDEAMRALAAVDWNAKAPIIQAIGVSAEGLVALFCRRDAARALELCRQARALASVSGVVPGASQTARYHGVCVGVCEAVAGSITTDPRKALEEAAAEVKYPSLQLFACFGLALVREQEGNQAGARALRDYIAAMAPHAAPLRLTPAELSSGPPVGASGGSTDESSSVAAVLAAGPPPSAATVVPGAARRGATKAALRLVGLWGVLIIAFLVVWSFMSAGKR